MCLLYILYIFLAKECEKGIEVGREGGGEGEGRRRREKERRRMRVQRMGSENGETIPERIDSRVRAIRFHWVSAVSKNARLKW